MGTKIVYDSSLTAVADAIRQRGGTSASLEFPAEFISAIGAIPSGGGDYDWSWVKDDGNTYLYIEVGEYWKEYRIQYYQETAGVNVVVSWGDGNTTTTTTRDHQVLTHTYTSSGAYVVKIDTTNSNIRFTVNINSNTGVTYRTYHNMLRKAEIGQCYLGTNELLTNCYNCEAVAFMATNTVDTTTNTILGNNLYKLKHYKQKITTKVMVVQYSLSEEAPFTENAASMGSLSYNRALKKVKIPKGIATAPLLQDDWSLEEITFDTPSSITALANSFCARCYSLKSVTLPEGLTSLSSNSFYECQGLEYISIPSTVTSISSGSFNNCVSMREFHIKAATPPTMGGAYLNAFTASCVIYVPIGKLTAYQTASNWSAYASLMQEESA